MVLFLKSILFFLKQKLNFYFNTLVSSCFATLNQFFVALLSSFDLFLQNLFFVLASNAADSYFFSMTKSLCSAQLCRPCFVLNRHV